MDLSPVRSNQREPRPYGRSKAKLVRRYDSRRKGLVGISDQGMLMEGFPGTREGSSSPSIISVGRPVT